MARQDDPRLRDVEEVFLERAREDSAFLEAIFEECEELMAEGDYSTCGTMLQTYVVAADKLADTADLLNKSEEDMLAALKTPGALSQAQLEKLMEFLKM
ncbi:MAG: hypothetical protein HND56_09545 [Pseudomonadota bacterium]|jgi:hypothetical protein|nr:hypothetical protein [Pseudomonadota bacterium]QKK05915.1 MAG: hypothetical protein HND56_09545 [Pseudomonadota bacterium]